MREKNPRSQKMFTVLGQRRRYKDKQNKSVLELIAETKQNKHMLVSGCNNKIKRV